MKAMKPRCHSDAVVFNQFSEPVNVSRSSFSFGVFSLFPYRARRRRSCDAMWNGSDRYTSLDDACKRKYKTNQVKDANAAEWCMSAPNSTRRPLGRTSRIEFPSCLILITCWPQLGFTGCYRILRDLTRFHWIFPKLTGFIEFFYRIL